MNFISFASYLCIDIRMYDMIVCVCPAVTVQLPLATTTQHRNYIMQVVLVPTQKCWFVIPFQHLPCCKDAGLLAFTGTEGVTTTPFVTHSHPFNQQLAKKVIFGVAVVFPVVISFGVDVGGNVASFYNATTAPPTQASAWPRRSLYQSYTPTRAMGVNKLGEEVQWVPGWAIKQTFNLLTVVF